MAVDQKFQMVHWICYCLKPYGTTEYSRSL